MALLPMTHLQSQGLERIIGCYMISSHMHDHARINVYMHAREDRIWVWNRYGTAYRSIYTLYEPWSQQLPGCFFATQNSSQHKLATSRADGGFMWFQHVCFRFASILGRFLFCDLYFQMDWNDEGRLDDWQSFDLMMLLNLDFLLWRYLRFLFFFYIESENKSVHRHRPSLYGSLFEGSYLCTP